MKRFFLSGLAALGLIALAPTESKADVGFGLTLAPDTHNTDLITMVTTDTATRTNIGGRGGTGTIIGTITIEIINGTTTGIEEYEINSCCPCAGPRCTDISIL